MNLNEFAALVHESHIIPHGNELANIHLCWSKALECWNNNEDMVWHYCTEFLAPRGLGSHCMERKCETVLCKGRDCFEPRGTAVYLSDGLIRLLDFAASSGVKVSDKPTRDAEHRKQVARCGLPSFVNLLHAQTTALADAKVAHVGTNIRQMVDDVYFWLQTSGVDLTEVMMERYRYLDMNSYRHYSGEVKSNVIRAGRTRKAAV